MSRDGTLPPGVEHWDIEEAQKDEGEAMSGIRIIPVTVKRPCSICEGGYQEPTVALLELGVNSNLIRQERLCWQHLAELRDAVLKAVGEKP